MGSVCRDFAFLQKQIEFEGRQKGPKTVQKPGARGQFFRLVVKAGIVEGKMSAD